MYHRAEKHGLLLSMSDPPAAVMIVYRTPVGLSILTAAWTGLISHLSPGYKDERPITGKGRPANGRKRLSLIPKSFFLGHNGPIIAAPEVDIENMVAQIHTTKSQGSLL